MRREFGFALALFCFLFTFQADGVSLRPICSQLFESTQENNSHLQRLGAALLVAGSLASAQAGAAPAKELGVDFSRLAPDVMEDGAPAVIALKEKIEGGICSGSSQSMYGDAARAFKAFVESEKGGAVFSLKALQTQGDQHNASLLKQGACQVGVLQTDSYQQLLSTATQLKVRAHLGKAQFHMLCHKALRAKSWTDLTEITRRGRSIAVFVGSLQSGAAVTLAQLQAQHPGSSRLIATPSQNDETSLALANTGCALWAEPAPSKRLNAIWPEASRMMNLIDFTGAVSGPNLPYEIVNYAALLKSDTLRDSSTLQTGVELVVDTKWEKRMLQRLATIGADTLKRHWRLSLNEVESLQGDYGALNRLLKQIQLEIPAAD